MSKLEDVLVEWALQKRRWPLLLPLGVPLVVLATKVLVDTTFNKAVLHPLSLVVCGLLLGASGGLYVLLASDSRKLKWSLAVTLILSGTGSLLVGVLSLRPVEHASNKLAVAVVSFSPISESARDAAKNITHRLEEELIERIEEGAPLIVMRVQAQVSGQTEEERREKAADLGRSREVNAQVVLWGEVRSENNAGIRVFAFAAVINPIVPSGTVASQTAITSGSLEESPIFGPGAFSKNTKPLSMLLAGLAHYKNGQLETAWQLIDGLDLGPELQRLASDLDPHRTLTRIQKPRITPAPRRTGPASAEDKFVLFGVLHTHSGLSYDVVADEGMLPLSAFEYAHRYGLDFLAVTDHHSAFDSPGRRRVMTPHEYQTQLVDVAMAYNDQHPNGLIAIPGFEWGTIKTGNHINVFGSLLLPPEDIKAIEYEYIYAWARTRAEFVQFNHPRSWHSVRGRNDDVGNFGEKRYSSSNEFVAATDQVVKTVSVITSVAGGYLAGRFSRSERKTHRAVSESNLAAYRRYLNLGMHVSPSANQDTHSANWGTVTAARTAVLVDEPTYQGLMKGISANRVYATEDDELAVLFRVRLNGETYWMGDTVRVPNEATEIVLSLRIWQTEGSDTDPTNEGPYTVYLYRDTDGVGGLEAVLEDTFADIESDKEIEIPVNVVPGEYLFLRVQEQQGKDNPIGDGADEVVNDTGVPGSDGLRDDLNDSAWTSPIWFSGAELEGTFVWSRNSGIYHDPRCEAVSRIGAPNRREGSAPAEKTKHNCSE